MTANFALVQPGIADAPRIIAALALACGDTNPPTVEQLTASTRPGPDQMKRPATGGGNFPGAVPTDPRLNSLLRQFIRPTNDVATVDKVLLEVQTHIKGNADLTKQARDGWIRILHFGDQYGTPYARKLGQEFLDKLKAGAASE